MNKGLKSHFHEMKPGGQFFPIFLSPLSAAELAQSVGRLTAEREVAGSIPGAGPILRVLKITKK